MNEKISLENVPDEILIGILLHLKPEDLFSFLQTSKRNYSVGTDKDVLDIILQNYNRENSGSPEEYDHYTQGMVRDHKKDYFDKTFLNAFDKSYFKLRNTI